MAEELWQAGTHCSLVSPVFSDRLWEELFPLKSPASSIVMEVDMPLQALADMAFHGAAPGSCQAGLSIIREPCFIPGGPPFSSCQS